MESPIRETDEADMDKIYVELEQLKKRIDRFICTVERDSGEEPRRKKIKTLTTKTKRLLMQHKVVKEELEYYENVYRKALGKNAKSLKRELRRDQRKLEDLKEKCRTQGVQVEVAVLEMNHKKQPEKRKRTNGSVFKGVNPKIKDKIKIQMRTKNKPAGRNIFKQKNPRLGDNIKIQIQKNNDTGRRELVFFNSGKAKQRFSNLVQKNEATSSNFRECRIMLQKLTEEQARRYIGEKKSPENGKRKSADDKSDWQIRIPREVLEESQNEAQIAELNTSESSTKPKRPRSTEKLY